MEGAARRAPRASWVVALLGVAAVVFVAVVLLDGGSNGHASEPAPSKRYAVLALQSPHVASSYPTYPVGPSEEAPKPPPAVPGTSAAGFAAPIAAYRRYAEGRVAAARGDAGRMTAALEAGSRAGAEESWRATYSRYLELGGAYLTGDLAALNERIDGTPGGLPGGVSSPRFTGLHRIEYGLWNGASPASLAPVSRRLEADLAAMAAKLPRATITPTEYSTRAHEILEDAERDQVSGAAVPWSGEGVIATEAGLTATEKVMATLHPLLNSGDTEVPPVGPPIEAELSALRETLARIEAEHGGRLPANGDLTGRQSEALHAALGAALEALAQVPATLEAEASPKQIQIPKKAERIEP